jgi:hypothetical protein
LKSSFKQAKVQIIQVVGMEGEHNFHDLAQESDNSLEEEFFISAFGQAIALICSGSWN